jgi:hypothetical protein
MTPGQYVLPLDPPQIVKLKQRVAKLKRQHRRRWRVSKQLIRARTKLLAAELGRV